MNEELTGMLQKLPLHPLLIVLSEALPRAGFGYVQILDRRKSHQKSRLKGCELLAELSLGTLHCKVVFKVLAEHQARIRALDELRGTVDRLNAAAGVIVAPCGLTQSAKSELPNYTSGIVSALEGPELAQLLTTYHIGVRSRGSVDYAYFMALEEIGDKVIEAINLIRP